MPQVNIHVGALFSRVVSSDVCRV